ncbi:MAG TPA: flagellar basal body rod protein FlgC [Phycisphaerae bacterium]|nr:flagellar basal body rod protein FlgC [Phycisphaerae bacterium]
MFDALDISVSALQAQRIRMDTVAGNLANAFTTRNADGQGEPYRRRFVVFAEGDGGGGRGVHVGRIGEDPAPPRLVHEPGHPDADANGYVRYPNVQVSTEMINALEAARAYEANITAMQVTKSMVSNTLRLLA